MSVIDFKALAEPFSNNEVKTRVVGGGRKADYITARTVMNRLDKVVGPANWRDEYVVLPNGAVMCTLYLRIDGEWVGKTDIGTESNTEKEKGAFSDAFKRAAVRWGIGRELYHDGTAFDDDDTPPSAPRKPDQSRRTPQQPASEKRPITRAERSTNEEPVESMAAEMPEAAQDDMFPTIGRIWPNLALSLYKMRVPDLASKGIQVGTIVYPAIGNLGYADDNAVKAALGLPSITAFDGTLEQLLNAVIDHAPAIAA